MVSRSLYASLAVASSALPQGYTFAAYVKEFQKDYSPEEYRLRETIFNLRLSDMLSHNEQYNAGVHTWAKGVNHFFDMTEEEIGVYTRGGYKHGATASFLTGARHEPMNTTALPTSVDWRTAGAITPVKNQGGCGSCWAFASTETLESAWFLKTGTLPVLSPQQLVDCTPNPNNCGGTGGCGGATAELAYNYLATLAKNGGQTSEAQYPYKGVDGVCKDGSTTAMAGISGFTKLTENSYDDVMNTLATVGPIAVAVDASSWSFYSSGIFNGCPLNKNIDIDHLVQLVGYGVDGTQLYWIVRNSWGASWGEKGYIRLARQTSDYCGQDNTPSDGSGCSGGPPVVTVCGTCGVLYDTVIPIVKA